MLPGCSRRRIQAATVLRERMELASMRDIVHILLSTIETMREIPRVLQ